MTEGEHLKRQEIFTENLKKMVNHNTTKKSSTQGLTQFADLTSDEFSSMYLSFDSKMVSEETRVSSAAVAPSTLDWRNQGVLTPVKDQKQCGSCWAFSAIETLESREKLAGQQLVVLSEQELVDCDKVDSGCQGGIMQNAYDYLKAHGVTSENAYPYTAANGTCTVSNDPVVFNNVTGYKMVGQTTDALSAELVNGPVAIAVDAGNNWQLYTSGVIENADCGDALDHGVQVVG